jgi:hypothetical protein
MPAWRSGLALSALVIPSLQWGFLVGVTAIGLANQALGNRYSLDPSVIYVAFLAEEAGLLALVLAVALKRAPRIQTMLACVLMIFVIALATYS